MKILFIGDNVVKGSIGVNWVKWLAAKNPGWDIENAGENGQTLSQIKERAEKKLEAEKYDLVFFEAGLNDLLLPAMTGKGFLFRQTYKWVSQSAEPCETKEDFEREYEDAILKIKSRTDATIILSTLGCISENLEHPLNRKRCDYNNIIRDVAIGTGCSLVDAGAVFDGYLRRCRTRNYFMEGYLNTRIFDRFQCQVMGCPDYLSKKRGLHLTIDGVHLNSRGANLFRDETERQIKSLIACCNPDPRNSMSNLEVY